MQIKLAFFALFTYYHAYGLFLEVGRLIAPAFFNGRHRLKT
ncbi:MAG: hypothetical protein OXU76_00295 [Alphaproteobacteria bacterium]|nr:hypothetical protein [Alphaproteobacteria bacterium]